MKKLFEKQAVAWVVLILAVALAALWGYNRKDHYGNNDYDQDNRKNTVFDGGQRGLPGSPATGKVSQAFSFCANLMVARQDLAVTLTRALLRTHTHTCAQLVLVLSIES